MNNPNKKVLWFYTRTNGKVQQGDLSTARSNLQYDSVNWVPKNSSDYGTFLKPDFN